MKHLAIILLSSACIAGASTILKAGTIKTVSERQVALPENIGTLSSDERSAMEFLYKYMPLPDIADHTADFYLDNVRSSLKARAEMPWGREVPEREFMHFVLPLRVNNEDLDSCRMVFYAELRDRVSGLSMTDAILEVNHWCHEKVTYQPSDARTSSPLATVKSALGRCGEESTFTVAALRAVGIPARQVYTPRWAHTDDNHAWVEAWADGRWHFLGACEPEAVLDLGWFNAPASRGMLMTTKVFGHYDGPEEILEVQPTATVINVTSNYAPVTDALVRITDRYGNPAAGADVAFGIYNYAEYFPAAVKQADAHGVASLTSGLGDMVVWATDGKYYGLGKVSAAHGDTATIVLDRTAGASFSTDFDIVPPRVRPSDVKVSAAQHSLNEARKIKEDSIRRSYESTFAHAAMADRMSTRTGLDAWKLMRLLNKSRGNHATLSNFLLDSAVTDKQRAFSLLTAVSEKDLRDVSAAVLYDHYLNTPPVESTLYDAYVLNPRIEFELLTPYKAYLRDKFIHSIPDAPALVRWVSANIAIDSVWNPLGLRMSPRGVFEQRLADPRSRSIFFVAAARSLGFPARIDPVTGKTQYADDGGNWLDVQFGAPVENTVSPRGTAQISYHKAGNIAQPGYYSHFTIGRLENGRPHTLEFGDFVPLDSIAPDGRLELDAGDYVITTGQRLADGSVLARTKTFSIAPGSVTPVTLDIRQDTTAVQVIGSFNSENRYHDPAEGGARSLLSATGRGYYVLGLISPNHEPSAHALNDIAARKADFEKWGKKLVVLFDSENSASRFDAGKFPALPENLMFGNDIDGTIRAELSENLGLDSAEMPVFVIADTFNRVVFATQGYNIRLGDTLLSILSRLEE